MLNGQLIGLTILQRIKDKKITVLTIKHSLKLIARSLALGKLAKEFKVETQKDHFPHYFLLYSKIDKSLDYEGTLPEYPFFEPKRTTPAEYDEMKKEFQEKDWSFLEVSRKYIKGDIEAQYQIIVKFFQSLKSEFPINPLSNLSIPGIAFTT